VMRSEVIASIRLRAVGFDFEPELTAKLLLSGRQITEVRSVSPEARGRGQEDSLDRRP